MLKKFLSTAAFIAFILLWIEIISKTQHLFTSFNPFMGQGFTELGMILFVCILAPLIEELMFRKVPLDFARKYKKNTGHDYTMTIALLSSYIFANVHNGPYRDVLQGFGGFLLCLLYIRNNYSYWYNVLAHMGWNFGVLYLLPIIEKIW